MKMVQYQKIVEKLSGDFVAVMRTDCLPHLVIPLHPANTDYQEYLGWVAEGHEPLPADE